MSAALKLEIERCDCCDCSASDHPCAFDCDYDEMCEGCRNSEDTKLSIQFDFDCLTGKL